MTTQFNLNFIAAHPRKISDDAPESADLLAAVENAVNDLGMVPVSAIAWRQDDTVYDDKVEKEWAEKFPPNLLLAVAKLLDGFRGQLVDPDSDVFDQDLADEDSQPGCGYAYMASVDLTEKYIQYRGRLAQEQLEARRMQEPS